MATTLSASVIVAGVRAGKIYRYYETVADMLADNVAMDEGDFVQCDKDYWFTVANSAAVDHDLANTGSQSKFYIAPQTPGVYDFGAWGPDLTGVESIETKLEAALAKTIAGGDNVTLLMPGGPLNHEASTATNVALGRGQTFNWKGNGATQFNMVDSGISFRPESQYFLTTTITTAVAAGADSVILTDATDVQIGDLLHIDCNVSIETGWGYGKEELRTIIDIDGNQVWVNLPFYWPHDPADTGHVVHVSWPSYAHIDGIHFTSVPESGNGGPSLSMNFLSGGSIRNGSVRSTNIGWTESEFSDGPGIGRCSGVILDNMDMQNLRYAPKFLGSFMCGWQNSRAYGIRHPDMNEWSQHCWIMNINSVYSQGVIQSHPNIGGMFINVADGVRSDSTYGGIDLRGLGEIVRDCRVSTKAPAGVQNTNNPLIKDEYDYLCLQHRRIISNFYAPKSTPAAGRDGWTLFDNVTAYSINTKNMENYSICEIMPNCQQLFDPDLNFSGNHKAGVLQRFKPVDAPLVRRFRTTGAVKTIAAITQANPAVITIAGHGLSDGDFVYVWGGTMTQIEGYYTVTSSSTDEFGLTTLEGVVVDSTSYTAYTANGKVTQKLETDAIDLNVITGVGTMGKAHVHARLAENEASTFTKTFLFLPHTYNNIQNTENWTKMTFRAGGATAFSETQILYNYRFNGGQPTVYEVAATDTNAAVLTIPTPTVAQQGSGFVTAEGAANYATNIWARAYLQVDVTVTATELVEWLTVDIENWEANILPATAVR